MMMRASLLALVLAAFASQAAAQNAPPPDELLALNFYVQQGDRAATDAELRRLQLKYPLWQPPADLSLLWSGSTGVEVEAIYRLIGAGQVAQAREAIAGAEAAHPGWHPPAEMLALIATAEGQAALDKALEDKDLTRAIEIASGTPGLLRCDRINNAWRIAEAQAAAMRPAEALATYRAVAAACTRFEDLTATLEKADAVADAPGMAGLFALVTERFPDRKAELDALAARLAAGHGDVPAEAGEAETPAEATGTDGKPLPARAAAPPATRPAAGTEAAGPEAGTPAAAPKAAAATGGGGGGGAGAVRAAAAAGDLTRCMALSEGSKSTAVIYERGWCAYNLDRPMEALAAFRQASAGRLDKTQNRDARFGMALAYLKMKMPEEAAQLAATTDLTHEQRVDIEGQILDQRGVAAYKKRQYRKAIGYFDALEQVRGNLSRDLAVLRAYSYLNSGNRARAHALFLQLHDELATDETARGLRDSQ
jgi:tetratricopeptide (TPR) repeat protein